jgi:hypothetical protein
MSEVLKHVETPGVSQYEGYEVVNGIDQDKARRAWSKLRKSDLVDSRIIGMRFEFLCNENNVPEIGDEHFEVLVLTPAPKMEKWPSIERTLNSFLLVRRGDGEFIAIQDKTLLTTQDGRKLFRLLPNSDVDLILDDISRGVVDTTGKRAINEVVEDIRGELT